MNIKSILCAIIMTMALSSTLYAQKTMYIHMNDGTSDREISYLTVRKITFSDGNANILMKDASTESYATKKIHYINFKKESSGVATATTQDIKIGICGDAIRITGWDNSKTATVSLCNVGGQALYSNSRWNGTDIPVTGKGIMILRINDDVYKFVKE